MEKNSFSIRQLFELDAEKLKEIKDIRMKSFSFAKDNRQRRRLKEWLP